MPGWTDAEARILTEIWSDKGLSAERMIEFLPGRTRNSIIGMARRLKLPSKKGKPTGRPPRPKKEAAVPIRPITHIAHKPPALTPPQGPFIPFMKSNSTTCRAIMDGRGEDGLALFCSNKKTEDSSFCPYHYDIFYQKKTA